MNRTTAGVLATFAIVFASCVSPTGMCACPPARTKVVISGAVTGASGALITNAHIRFEQAPHVSLEAYSLDSQYISDLTTDAAGMFRAQLYSTFSPGTFAVRAGIVQSGITDTIWVNVGQATFRNERETPDTVRATLRLP